MSFSLAQTLPLSCLLESPAPCPGGLKEHMALVLTLNTLMKMPLHSFLIPCRGPVFTMALLGGCKLS